MAAIAESDSGLLGSTTALQDLTQGLRMTQSEAQNFISRLEEDNWLFVCGFNIHNLGFLVSMTSSKLNSFPDLLDQDPE